MKKGKLCQVGADGVGYIVDGDAAYGFHVDLLNGDRPKQLERLNGCTVLFKYLDRTATVEYVELVDGVPPGTGLAPVMGESVPSPI